MSHERHIASASTFVAEPPERVWAELLHPGARWVLGANIESDFQVGSPVTFEGHFFGRQFEDHGTVLAFERPRLMHFTHYSPLSGLPDVPENYHDIRILLEPTDGGTRILVEQRNIDTPEHARSSREQWTQALTSLAHSDGAHRR
ncbi:ATPase [Xylanimonas allomyrinae]|uniref:ATPase n=1 Tax=Xylanimonas allomyrinae TaxID=2509459 RepID=A0A4P6EQE7_9MICO|nr:SRPBCC family protein [Xylanimonas allomyrinae]QAY64063.1 ATPase [Xylanimonas allomyrinae]